MAKRAKVYPIEAVIEDRFVTVEDVCNLLSITASHVYMLEKFGQIKAIDISVAGNGGPNTRRYSLKQVREFARSRTVKIDEADEVMANG